VILSRTYAQYTSRSRGRVQHLKKELLDLKEQQTQEKQDLNLQLSESKITKQQAMKETLEISKRYTPRVEELTEILHKLGIDLRNP
jgi:adenylosuccinate synthase